MAFKSFKSIVEAEQAGQTFFSAWRKVPSQVTNAGIWFDLSMSPGNPVPNYYASTPNVAISLAQSKDGGIPHGSDVKALGFSKCLKSLTTMSNSASAAPMSFILCDYLMYYPFVDMSITDPQPMTTSIALPRYPSGAGVQIMAVEVAGQSGVGNPQFQIQYTNQNGVTGRLTQVVTCNTQTVNGTIISTATATARSSGPFLPLAPGDTGVRKIESVQFLSADTGLISFVLVQPIENSSIRAIDAPVERIPVTDFSDLPLIVDDAYLNLICLPNGNLSGVSVLGTIETFWS